MDNHGNAIFEHHQANVEVCVSTVTRVVNNSRSTLRQPPNFQALRPFLGWSSLERVKKTLENTTQFFRRPRSMDHHHKSRFPAMNVRRLNEAVSTDPIFSDVPAGNDGISGHAGCTMAQVFMGKDSLYTKIYPMHKESEMPQVFEDFVREVGAPTVLITDNSKVQLGKAAKTLLRFYAVGDYQSEPGYQQQNPVERRVKDVKAMHDGAMNRSGAPAMHWLICMLYFIVPLLNVLAHHSFNWKTPTKVSFAVKPDILVGFFQFKEWCASTFNSGTIKYNMQMSQ